MEVFCKFHGKENLSDVLINGFALFDESVFQGKRKENFEGTLSKLNSKKRLSAVLELTTKLEIYIQEFKDYDSILKFCDSFFISENKKGNERINLDGSFESDYKAEKAFQSFKRSIINCRAYYYDQKKTHEPLAIQNCATNQNKKLLVFRDEFACVSHFWKHSIKDMNEKQYLDKIYLALNNGEKFIQKINKVQTDFYYFHKVETEKNRLQVIVECYKGAEETIKTAYYSGETEYA